MIASTPGIALRGVSVEAGDRARGDGALHQHGVDQVRHREFGGVLRRAGDLQPCRRRGRSGLPMSAMAALPQRHGWSAARATRAAAQQCDLERVLRRGPRRPPRRAAACATGRSAQPVLPVSAASTSGRRHGLVPTPPAATRAVADCAAFDVERDGGGDEREFEARPVAHLQVVRALRGGRASAPGSR